MAQDEAVQGGIQGLLIGDAPGVPCERYDPADLPSPEQIELLPPPPLQRAHQGTPPGACSDDHARALTPPDNLLTCGGLDAGGGRGRRGAGQAGGEAGGGRCKGRELAHGLLERPLVHLS
ncbi:MAG TPA: ADP-ribosylglycohydrolase family protein [Deltaproteobacteria bacterium]|nr:ADP-ribosylglycohydrolase family protein [Deltaproteobacteria bacterium]